MEVTEFLEKKQKIIKQLSDNLKGWNDSYEGAQAILEENERHFQDLRVLDGLMSESEVRRLNGRFEKEWRVLLELQREVMACVEEERQSVQENINQISKKEKIVSNYISLQKKSIFVERNL